LLRLSEAYHLALIEDACQAHAATVRGKAVGGFGTGCFSFYATKNITTGEGGMVTTNDPDIAERVRLLRSHGQKERYHHINLGYNLRMTDIQGAMGIVQLKRLESLTVRRIAHATFLTQQLCEAVQTPIVRPEHRHVYHQYTIQVPGARDEWMQLLRERGVASAVHYPVPIHQQPFYLAHKDSYRCETSQRTTPTTSTHGDMQLPVTESVAQQVLSLPVHPALSKEDLKIITKEVLNLCH
jgi:dTDP-4-amino-4,6-dideoxygalactose transaminase